jgi:hypothetical protein
MNDQRPPNERLARSGPDANAATEEAERRSAERKPFIAETRVIELNNSATKIFARSCDLTIHGCYVDTLNPLPVGTLVRVILKKENAILDVKGSVVYRTHGLGMGIAFFDLTSESHALLQKWLSRVGMENEDFHASFSPTQMEQPALVEDSKDQIVQLIEMLAKKGILNRTEAGILLKKPIE